jgi:hypothetical protein
VKHLSFKRRLGHGLVNVLYEVQVRQGVMEWHFSSDSRCKIRTLHLQERSKARNLGIGIPMQALPCNSKNVARLGFHHLRIEVKYNRILNELLEPVTRICIYLLPHVNSTTEARTRTTSIPQCPSIYAIRQSAGSEALRLPDERHCPIWKSPTIGAPLLFLSAPPPQQLLPVYKYLFLIPR